MKLDEYLSARGLTCEAFAEKIGVTGTSVWRYAHGERLPRPATMRRIVEATDGAVTAQDFYSSADSEAA